MPQWGSAGVLPEQATAMNVLSPRRPSSRFPSGSQPRRRTAPVWAGAWGWRRRLRQWLRRWRTRARPSSGTGPVSTRYPPRSPTIHRRPQSHGRHRCPSATSHAPSSMHSGQAGRGLDPKSSGQGVICSRGSGLSRRCSARALGSARTSCSTGLSTTVESPSRAAWDRGVQQPASFVVTLNAWKGV